MSPRLSVRLLATQSDERLLELVAAGHERAFEALVLRHRRPLLGYCGRLGLSHARAEDVVQQSLLKAWLAVREGTVVHDARPWLYRIVHNTAVNALRSRPEEHLDRLEPARLIAPGAEHEPDRRIAARAALAEVAALPDMQRDVIVMSAVAGRSHEEVANALGISSGAVRGLLYRARAALRSAAAAIMPQPLIAWAAGAGGPASSTAGRLVEISSAGGGDLAPALVKGAVLGITAALAAGAVLVPVHPPAHRAGSRAAGHSRAAQHGVASPAVLGSGLAATDPALARSSPASARDAQGRADARSAAPGGSRDNRGGRSRGERSGSRDGERRSGGGTDAGRRDNATTPESIARNGQASGDRRDGGVLTADGRVEGANASRDGGGSDGATSGGSTSGDTSDGGGSPEATQPAGGGTVSSDGSGSGSDGGQASPLAGSDGVSP